MKTGFKDSIEPKNPKKSIKSPWNFEAPCYDERSSCYVSAGTNYGVGKTQPVGHEGNPRSEGVPKGRVNTMSLYPNPTKAEIE